MIGGFYPGGGYPGGDFLDTADDLTKAGHGTAGSVGSGQSVSETAESGAGTVGLTGAGPSASEFARTSAGIAGTVGSGTGTTAVPNSIHAVGGGTTDSYVEKNSFGLTPFTDPIYIGMQVYIPSATATAWAAVNRGSPYFLFTRRDNGAFLNGNFLYDVDLDNVYDVFEDEFAGDVSTWTDGTWFKFEWEVDPTNGPGPEKIWVDEALVINSTFGPGANSHPCDKAWIGAISNHGGLPDGDVYVGEIRVGKSYNAFDVFHFIPATASDLSAFDAVAGTVTLDTAPTPPPPWSGTGEPAGAGVVGAAGYGVSVVADTTAPVLQLINAAGSRVILRYDETLQTVPGPSPSEFAVLVNGTARAITDAYARDTDVVLTITTPVLIGDTVLVTYTP